MPPKRKADDDLEDEDLDRKRQLIDEIKTKIQCIEEDDAIEYVRTLAERWHLDNPPESFEHIIALAFHNFQHDVAGDIEKLSLDACDPELAMLITKLLPQINKNTKAHEVIDQYSLAFYMSCVTNAKLKWRNYVVRPRDVFSVFNLPDIGQNIRNWRAVSPTGVMMLGKMLCET